VGDLPSDWGVGGGEVGLGRCDGGHLDRDFEPVGVPFEVNQRIAPPHTVVVFYQDFSDLV
jgi:hypothetical protein